MNYAGGFDENDIINTLGYDTTPLAYEDQHGDEQTLERGDSIFYLYRNCIQHRKDSIELSTTVDKRGVGEDTDVGQYWGIDNVYVRLWSTGHM